MAYSRRHWSNRGKRIHGGTGGCSQFTGSHPGDGVTDSNTMPNNREFFGRANHSIVICAFRRTDGVHLQNRDINVRVCTLQAARPLEAHGVVTDSAGGEHYGGGAERRQEISNDSVRVATVTSSRHQHGGVVCGGATNKQRQPSHGIAQATTARTLRVLHKRSHRRNCDSDTPARMRCSVRQHYL